MISNIKHAFEETRVKRVFYIYDYNELNMCLIKHVLQIYFTHMFNLCVLTYVKNMKKYMLNLCETRNKGQLSLTCGNYIIL